MIAVPASQAPVQIKYAPAMEARQAGCVQDQVENALHFTLDPEYCTAQLKPRCHLTHIFGEVVVCEINRDQKQG
jgi:hypothetical protein